MNAIHDLDHMNVCRFFEWYETPKHIWCIKELCLGGTLRKILSEDGRIPESAVREFSIDVVRGLTYLHSNSIAMADLCPEKVTTCVLLTDPMVPFNSSYDPLQLRLYSVMIVN